MAVKIAIKIEGDSIEEESAIANVIAEGLAQRGFVNIRVLASQQTYVNEKRTEELISKDTPIMTCVSEARH